MGEKKFRIHQVAKRLGKTSREVMDACAALEIECKSHLSSVTEGDLARIEAYFNRPPSPPESIASAVPTSRMVPPTPTGAPVDLDQVLKGQQPKKAKSAGERPTKKRSRPRPVPAVTLPGVPPRPASTAGSARASGTRPVPPPPPPQRGERVQQPKQALTPELLRKIREKQKSMQTGQIPRPKPQAGGQEAPRMRILAVPKHIEKEEEGRRGPRGIGEEGRLRRRARRVRRRERTEEEELLRDLSALDDEAEEPSHEPQKPFRQRRREQPQPPRRPERVVIEPPLTVRSFSEALGVKATDILRRLITLGYAATINSSLEPETAALIADDLGIDVEIKQPKDPEEEVLASIKPDPAKMVPRPPVVTLLGHVDHGKTSLLDRIRRTNVAATEAGGITQCIRAWQVERDGRKITFLDTPGHEAFTAMRARGAQVTDIAVIVVAADDGVMPQTVEAISHAKAAGVDIIVAINKCDLPTARPERVLQQLAQHDLIPDEWDPVNGVPCIRCSAVTGQGIDELLDHILLLAEARELKADPTVPAIGVCLEASRDEGRGVLATFLIQQGTLHRSDIVVCGVGYGRIRSMWNDQDRMIKEAGPGTPVLVSGLNEVPNAGDKFLAVEDMETARRIAEKHIEQKRLAQPTTRKLTLEDILAGKEKKQLPLVIRADTHGSLEAIEKELQKFQDDEVEVRVLHRDVGAITESDVLLAEASAGIIVGFNVGVEPRARQAAETKGIEIRRYRIIYELSDDIRAALEGMLTPERHIEDIGEAEVLQTFRIRGVGTVAGCRVRRGRVLRNAYVRVLRDGRVIYPDPESDRHVRIVSLKRFKEDAQEVRAGFECGLRIEGFDDVKVGDVLEVYEIKEVRRSLGERTEAAEPVGAGAS